MLTAKHMEAMVGPGGSDSKAHARGGRGLAYRFASDAKEVEAPQVDGTLPVKLLLCSAMVDRLAKQLVVPQVGGRAPLRSLPCRESACKDCNTAATGAFTSWNCGRVIMHSEQDKLL